MRLRSTVPVAAAALLTAIPSGVAAAPVLRHTPRVRAGRTAATRAPRGRVALPLSAASVPAGARRVAHAAGDRVDVLVGLRGRDEAGLDRLVDAVSDPASEQYGHYLSPARFRARFAPPAASADAVAAFARASGLTVAGVPANRRFVRLTGSLAAAERAFATPLQAVRVDGRLAHVPTGTPSVPAALRGIVTTVEGLDSSRTVRPYAATSPPAFVNAGPCSTYWGEKTATDVPGALGQAHLPYVPCGYTPAQLRSAYGVDAAAAAGLDGKGVTVGIIDAFDYPGAKADLTTYSAKHGLSAPDYTDLNPALTSVTPEVPMTPLDPDGWAGEQMLDVEAVHAMAPAAKLVYRGAVTPLNPNFTMAQNDMVDGKEAQIVSNSYGGASDDADANTDAILKQAAATGIGFYFSSGDQGDETQDPNGPGDREVDTSANNPLATAVGGTALAVGQDGSRQFETGWGTYSAELTGGAFPTPTFNSGGGGGTSQSYAQPDYQQGVVPDSIARHFDGKPVEASQEGSIPPFVPHVPGRAVPDVAMDADPQTGMLVGLRQDFSAAANPGGIALPTDDVHYGEFRIGGTSLSSPLFAGFMALADQAAGKAHGFANPALYAASKNASAFHDVTDPPTKLGVIRRNFTNSTDASGGTQTFLRTLNDTATLHTLPGYDDVTGLGTPAGAGLVKALAPSFVGLTAAGAPTGATSPVTGKPCTGGRKLRIRVHHLKGERLVRARITFAGRRTRTVRRRAIRSVTVTLPAKRRRLTITTFSNRRTRTTSRRTLTACGPFGKVKTVRKRHRKR